MYKLWCAFTFPPPGVVHGRLPQQPLCPGIQVNGRLHGFRQLHLTSASSPLAGTGRWSTTAPSTSISFQSNTVIKFDFKTATISKSGQLDYAGYNNRYHYSWGGHSDIDLMVDESGLWAVYATNQTQGTLSSARSTHWPCRSSKATPPTTQRGAQVRPSWSVGHFMSPTDTQEGQKSTMLSIPTPLLTSISTSPYRTSIPISPCWIITLGTELFTHGTMDTRCCIMSPCSTSFALKNSKVTFSIPLRYTVALMEFITEKRVMPDDCSIKRHKNVSKVIVNGNIMNSCQKVFFSFVSSP